MGAAGRIFLSVILPVEDGAGRVGAVVAGIIGFGSRQAYRYELVCVFDGGSDSSFLELQKQLRLDKARLANCEVHVIKRSESRGRAEALRRGVAAARGDYVLLCDAGMTVSLERVPDLVGALNLGCDMAIGSRFGGGPGAPRGGGFGRRFSGAVYRGLVRALAGIRIADVEFQLACLKRRTAADILPGWLGIEEVYQLEIILLLERYGLRVVEVPAGCGQDEAGPGSSLCDAGRVIVKCLRLRSRYAASGGGAGVPVFGDDYEI
jgi:glycosyltransferase involved in cell wall biosynthesis